MISILKIILKSVLVLTIAAIVVVGLALVSATKNPIITYERKNNISPLDTYAQKRSEQDTQKMKQKLEILAKTGSCVGCDFGARRGEEEKKDLYQAIQSAKNKGLTIDLSGAGLFMVKLAGVDLNNANLSGADLLGADLTDANLSGANLKGVCLDGAKLNGANLSNANLTGAHLGVTKLSGADLTNAILHKAKLSFATNLSEANLTHADLTDAMIYNIHSHKTKFVGADLRGARINTKFAKNADLTGAKFDGWIMRSFNTLTLWISMIKPLIDEKLGLKSNQK